MAYIGRDIEQGLFTKQTFTADSSTTVFALSHAVSSANNLLVSVGGVIQEPDSAYTASGTVLTFTGTPTTGDLIWVVYLGKTGSSSTSRGAIVKQTGVGDGTTTPITLSTSAVNSASIIVTLNGVVQVPDTDFVASGTTLTFTTAPSAALAILVYFLSAKARLGKPAAGSVTAATLASSGTLPAVNGSALTGVLSHADLNVLRTNISLAGFNRSTDHATTVLGMPNGFIDQFEDQTGVDDPSSTNETYASGRDFYMSANHIIDESFAIDLASAGYGNNNGWSGYSLRGRIPASALSISGSTVRIKIWGGPFAPLGMNAVYIGHAAATGNAWDFDGNQRQVTFNGGSSAAEAGTNHTLESDEVSFTLDSSRDLIFAINVVSNTSKDDTYGGAQSGYSYYYKAAEQSASSTTASGFTSTSNVHFAVASIEAGDGDAVNRRDSLPDMTANNAPSGTALASTENAASNAAWIAMSNDSANSWVATATTGFLQFGFNNGQTAKIINKYTIEAQTGQATRAPRNWTFKGSNDGTTFTTLDTQTNQSFVSGERKIYNNFTNTTSYVFYRLDITANNGSSSLSIQEFELHEAYTISDITLVSETSTASASPDNAHIALFNEEVDALTLDTDIMAWASRSKQTMTATNASNVLNATAHGLSNGDRVMLTTTESSFPTTKFDGSDFVTINEATLGAADGQQYILSMVVKFAADGTSTSIVDNTGSRFYINRSAGNLIRVMIRDASGNNIYDATTTGAILAADGFVHLLIGIDLTDSTQSDRVRILKDGVLQGVTIGTAATQTNVDITRAAFTIGADSGTTSGYTGMDITHFYLAQEAMDFSVAANIAKFYKESYPINLGTNGSTPTGTQPIIYLNNAFGTFQTNLGSGGNFTEGGTLSLGDSYPKLNLPSQLSRGTVYYVVNKTTNTFKVSMTSGGSAVAFTDDGTGTHSVRAVTKAALVDRGDFETGKATLSALVDISGQPTDTDMSLIVQTKNNKGTKLHGMSMQYT